MCSRRRLRNSFGVGREENEGNRGHRELASAYVGSIRNAGFDPTSLEERPPSVLARGNARGEEVAWLNEPIVFFS